MEQYSPAPADDTSSSLIVRIKNQDPDAWLRLVKWVGPFLLRWCRRAGLQTADCEEVSQEVLKDVCRGFPTFRKDNPKHSFRGWVYRITRNCIIDLQRKQPPSPNALPFDLPAEPDPSEAQDLKQCALRLLLQDLIARHSQDPGFQAFYRTVVDDLSGVAVAEELHMTPEVVRQHKSRWKKRLKDRLTEQFGELLD